MTLLTSDDTPTWLTSTQQGTKSNFFLGVSVMMLPNLDSLPLIPRPYHPYHTHILLFRVLVTMLPNPELTPSDTTLTSPLSHSRPCSGRRGAARSRWAGWRCTCPGCGLPVRSRSAVRGRAPGASAGASPGEWGSPQWVWWWTPRHPPPRHRCHSRPPLRHLRRE